MLEPCGHRVLVKIDRVDEKVGSLFLPDTIRSREETAGTKGTLIAVGESAWVGFADGNPWAKVGDRVIFCKYGGVLMTQQRKKPDGSYEEKEEFRLMNDEDIMGRFNGEEEIV